MIHNIVQKTPADNEQFATSGGATRPSGSAEQHLLALVRALPMPPPAASCHHKVKATQMQDLQHIKNRKIL